MKTIKQHNVKSNRMKGDASLIYAAYMKAPSESATGRGLWSAFLKMLTRAEAAELIENRKQAAKVKAQ